MKNIWLALVVLFVLAGCTNDQDSSQSEARYTVEHLADFQELIQYFSVNSGLTILFTPEKPFIGEAYPEVDLSKGKNLIHVIIYKTKSQTFKLVLLEDSRPPEVVTVKEFK